MNRHYVASALLVAIIFVCSSISEAQQFGKAQNKNYWSVGVNANMMNYVGDVTGDKSMFSIPFSFTRENFGVCAIKRLSPRFSARGNFFYGKIKGNDRVSSNPSHASDIGRWERGANFKNTIYELSTTFMVDFYESRGKPHKRPDFNAYAFGGIGIIYHNPKMSPSNSRRTRDWVRISNMPHLGNFSQVQGVMIYGLGFKYKLDKKWDLALEVGWRKTTTDKLDGVWGKYEDTSDWSKEELALYDKTSVGTGIEPVNGQNWTNFSKPGEIRGKGAFDGYVVTGIHLTRILAGSPVCPKFR